MNSKYAIITCLIAGCLPAPLFADVIVLTNRTSEAVSFQVKHQAGQKSSYTIPVKELVSIPVTAAVEIQFGSEDASQILQVEPNSVCFFHQRDQELLELNRIGFAADVANKAVVDDTDSKRQDTAPPKNDSDPPNTKICTIPVKLFVDDEEPFVRKLWEARLRARLERASKIFEQHCRVRFEVVGVDTWDSNNEVRQFTKMLAEFERESRVEPAALAIGFSSQRRILQQRTRLGGTFAPLRQHILIREWSKNMGEAERLEVLLHELGHYLGATHSPEKDSAMRPQLNDGKANLRSFRLGFDPVNTLVMCLVGDEIREHNVRYLHELTPKTRQQLQSIYREIIKITPDEPATVRMLQLLGAGTPGKPSAPKSSTVPK
ncbi:Matrixin [Symmachiella macrocystis]|uniref:Matrixin n=1 Tax=Symmachiella macrocystis TaxID=2527985 RepID=A0A5C6BQW1_9PLAN|nr:M12 family metallo-peptidase [Symmachiella macrocystis]TWU14137.1 Matrixin [Symmachiella macrocystis]